MLIRCCFEFNLTNHGWCINNVGITMKSWRHIYNFLTMSILYVELMQTVYDSMIIFPLHCFKVINTINNNMAWFSTRLFVFLVYLSLALSSPVKIYSLIHSNKTVISNLEQFSSLTRNVSKVGFKKVQN